jgi:hypothetical protein
MSRSLVRKKVSIAASIRQEIEGRAPRKGVRGSSERDSLSGRSTTMPSPPATSRLFHSIVVMGLGTAAGGCGSGEPSGARADASSEAQVFLGTPGDAAPVPAPRCCTGPVSCADSGTDRSDGGDGGDPCCVVDDAGNAGASCCNDDNFACVPQPGSFADAGDAGVLCGCWPLFV